ncbi:MAG TPA: chromosome segregation protein SMC [Pyrinomonadaceae bacterium]|jgi:chromosome segregation protein|nr:chromosome segregation protein SMC [Pyrinomonadaceae bacterium]
MFKLQRLEITGFKSFADYTQIIFTGDGITAIVGPNGCGKSNVADAIAWVLGEQRVKHLRGGEMKDVIFQGSRNRPPSGMAEVVMHMVRDETVEHEPDIEDIDSTLEQIDDRLVDLQEILPQEVAPVTDVPPELTAEPASLVAESTTPPGELEVVAQPLHHRSAHKRHWRRRNLALEFAPGEAVSVTRRLYRSGESEYLLNDKICRLRDIQDLFSGTGLAGGHYAIIEQGRIGQILSAKPMDRRTIIEEAAGITKFRVRQRATEARLESARSNLSRITDIVSEIDRQVNSLRRQAAKARRYGVLREELRDLLRQVYVAEDRKLTILLDETKTKLTEIAELELGISEELTKREEEAKAATQEARSCEDSLTKARALAAEAVLQRDRQARECVYQQEQLGELEKRKSEVTAEIETLTSRLILIESECRRLQAEDLKLREEADLSAFSLRTAEESYAARVSGAATAEAAIENARADLLSQTAMAERLREIARQLEATLERLSQQAEGLAREGERAASQHRERKLEAEKFALELGDARERVARLQAERESAVDAVIRGHEAVSDTDAELTRVRDEFSRASHRLESLKELDHRRAYYSSAVQLVFSPSETPRDFHFIGTLADALNVEAKWERAVEGVLGSSLQAIVVPTPDDAVRAAQWLRENNGGRASFLVAGLHGGSEELDTLTCKLEERPALSLGLIDDVREDLRISDLLGAPQQLITVLKRTLPQKMNARLAANLEDAMTKSIATGEMYVTLNGDWIASGQFVNAGDARAVEEGAGLLAFKRELRELETRAQALGREVEGAGFRAKAARTRLVELEDAVVTLNEAIGREEREAMTRELTATGLEQEIERAERHLRVVAQDSGRVEAERIDVIERRTRALHEAETAEADRETSADNVIKASSLLADIRREIEVESEGLATQRATAAAAAERRRATTSELRRIEGELADFAARVERHRFELAEMNARTDDLKLSITDLERKASSVESDRSREEQEISSLTEKLQEARHRADAFSDELSELNRRAAEVRDSRAAMDVQRAEAQARQTFVHENCQTELSQSLEDLAREVVLGDDFDFETSHRRVEELRTRLEGFGGVNMMALEELGEAEERLLFLTVQRQDIIDGISSTEEALREIKRRSRERFRHAFEQVNKNFSELFKELFGGGRGEMSLIDADDVLESGIDVVAQPPGKRLQNVLLLSGGEKAMAALALVLGIFHYRPAPFCLLDEVDAPLDEANVGRFTDKVVQMSANTQFIVITHNKRTMEMARALYGVTMEDAGVSRLVSVKFE